jgi:UDP-glucuronate decarboxylase
MMSSVTLNHRRHEDDALQAPAAYSPKPPKAWTAIRPVDYLFREQRLVFILIGMAIASGFFIFSPSFVGVEQSAAKADTRGASSTWLRMDLEETPSNAGSKMPLGLRTKRLRIVVTGGAGFVGSHLVDRLMERGDSVIVLDSFFTGRKENLQRHFGNPRFELIRHDVVEPILLEVDQIYHLACPASPVHYKHNPVKTIISFLLYLSIVPSFLIQVNALCHWSFLALSL